MSTRNGVLAAVVTVAVLATGGAEAQTTLVGACAPTGLRATFRVVRGSAGAGQISYTVRLNNRSAASCIVSGRPALLLLDAHGHALPTRVVADRPGVTAALIRLAPGRTAIAIARFSPDIPGVGEPQRGRCEPVAHRIRVTLASPGSGRLTGPASPPTSVCQHGRITEGLLHAATG